MDEKTFTLIFRLHKEQPWIVEKESTLFHLLYNECNNIEQRELIMELLTRFSYLNEEEFNSALGEICDDITTDPDLEDNNTQILSMTGDDNTDSGQLILYALKSRFESRNWREHLAINKFGASYKIYKRNNQKHHNIILIDEFIGSGSTVLGRVKELKKTYSSNGITNIKIKVRVIAASTVGLNVIKENGIDVSCVYEIKKGISDFYKKNEIDNKINFMIDIENKLLQSFNNRAMPSLGYGGTESLYARENGNTPNSVFPVFWWPKLKDNSERPRLLIRAMGDA